MTTAKSRTDTLRWSDIDVGDEVTPLEIPVTTTMIVAGAIASRDFMPVHHDRDYANKQGSPNLFMNILTSNGYCVRFLTDWAGPEAMITKLAIRLGVPSFPDDPLRFTGSVTGKTAGVRWRELHRGDLPGGQQPRQSRLRYRRREPARRSPGMSASPSKLAGNTAIAGIGQTEFSKESGRSELQLACESVSAALDDAGLSPSDVDGMVTFTMDSSDEIDVARNVGIGDLNFFSRVPHGGGAAAGTVAHAAMAVAAGVADVVVCWRAFNERSGFRFGGSGRTSAETPLFMAHYAPFGLLTPAAWVALHAQRYMSTYGVTNEDFGRIAVVDRAHAATNPDAWFYERPITLEDHQNSRWIIEPVLRLLDCCQESDGGVALVVTSAERARDLRQPPAVISAAAQGAAYNGEMMTSYYREDITGLPEMGVVADKLWRDSGLKPQDIQTAFIYDHFTPFVFTQFEELGFCGRGEAKDFATVERLSLGGELPINTNGGLLGEAYIHGMNGITEGVRQVRGTSHNQVDNVEHVLVTSGTGVPTSGLILAGG